ncbi:MAG: 16S rRNA (cytosine(1402)-N(4))-methyltransferase RsmH [Patescibacteria group bacterium]
MSDKNKFHVPVMVEEVLNGLAVRDGGTYIDATVGGGGYSIEIIKRGGRLLGIDQDPEAVEFSKQNIKYGDWKIVQGNFRDIRKIAEEQGFDTADGILFDLGVSSHQIDTPDRGFSFRFLEAPLDLRMNPKSGAPAAEYIKKLSEEELYEIFATYGEEKLARSIARAVVRTRHVKSVTTVGDLVGVVDEVMGDARERMSTLARVFQALRIVVNDELGALKEGLPGAVMVLGSGGRIAALSYHSLEDRIVKREIVQLGLRSINKRPLTPSDTEKYMNVRSRSAKLRIAQKL